MRPDLFLRSSTRLLAASITLLTAALAWGTAASAATGRATTKVTVGSTWTLERTGTGCENDTFGPRSHFSSSITDGSGDGGTYKAKAKFTMTWRSGLASGAVFAGRWEAVDGIYTGRYSSEGQTVSASLVPYVTGACLSSTSMNAHPYASVVILGSGATDTATVYGNGDVAPTGTVTVYVCPGDVEPCTEAIAAADGATLSPVTLTATGGSAAARSPAYTPGAIGSYCFLAVYSGDSHYAVSSDGSTSDQCFTVSPPAGSS